VTWNVATWRRGIPSSSAQALVGGLVGAALAEGGFDAVNWGGVEGGHPVGLVGTLISLAISPPLGALAALLVIRVLRRLAHRATRRWRSPARLGEWVTAAALAFSHGANDAQKAVGVIAALLFANGRIESLSAPTWVIVICSAALTVGTALGGWRIIRTVGRGIYHFQLIEGLASTGASAGIIFGASLVGAPTSTSQVVASSVVGVGGGRRRWRHVHWEVVRHMGVAWLITLPSTALLAALVFELWQWLT
jgi:PiT family inorganic phosphate transporter